MRARSVILRRMYNRLLAARRERDEARKQTEEIRDKLAKLCRVQVSPQPWNGHVMELNIRVSTTYALTCHEDMFVRHVAEQAAATLQRALRKQQLGDDTPTKNLVLRWEKA